MRLHLCRPAIPEELPVVRASLRRFLQAAGASEDVIFQVLTACVEACGNAIRHPVEPSVARFEMKAKADHMEVRIMVRDFGRWRSPVTREAESGAMGLGLMRSLMDDVRLKQTRAGTFVWMVRTLRGRKLPARERPTRKDGSTNPRRLVADRAGA
jgi:anti-sigma regulatory factor (Ser/Thr protein kinase)